MARRFTEEKLVIASHNPGKVREIGALLAPHGMDVVSAGELGLPEPEETGTTFAENALIKARAGADGQAPHQPAAGAAGKRARQAAGGQTAQAHHEREFTDAACPSSPSVSQPRRP